MYIACSLIAQSAQASHTSQAFVRTGGDINPVPLIGSDTTSQARRINRDRQFTCVPSPRESLSYIHKLHIPSADYIYDLPGKRKIPKNMADSLKRTTSTRNSRVTMITSRTPPPVVKPEPASPPNALPELEDPPTLAPTLRRSTRSTPIGQNGESLNTTLDVSSYAYAPVTPSPRKRAKIEQVEVKPDIKTPVKSEDRPTMATPKSSAKKLPQLALEKPHKAPDKWGEQYRLIERMRKGIIAPVDNM